MLNKIEKEKSRDVFSIIAKSCLICGGIMLFMGILASIYLLLQAP